jgi:hypothetical protein
MSGSLWPANGDVKRSDVTNVTKVGRQAGGQEQPGGAAQRQHAGSSLSLQPGWTQHTRRHPRDSPGQGKHLSEFTDFTRRDSITTAIALPRLEGDEAEGYLFFATELGVVKRVTMEDFLAAAPQDPQVINVDAKDRLGYCLTTTGDQELILSRAAASPSAFRRRTCAAWGWPLLAWAA